MFKHYWFTNEKYSKISLLRQNNFKWWVKRVCIQHAYIFRQTLVSVWKWFISFIINKWYMKIQLSFCSRLHQLIAANWLKLSTLCPVFIFIHTDTDAIHKFIHIYLVRPPHANVTVAGCDYECIRFWLWL